MGHLSEEVECPECGGELILQGNHYYCDYCESWFSRGLKHYAVEWKNGKPIWKKQEIMPYHVLGICSQEMEELIEDEI